MIYNRGVIFRPASPAVNADDLFLLFRLRPPNEIFVKRFERKMMMFRQKMWPFENMIFGICGLAR